MMIAAGRAGGHCELHAAERRQKRSGRRMSQGRRYYCRHLNAFQGAVLEAVSDHESGEPLEEAPDRS